MRDVITCSCLSANVDVDYVRDADGTIPPEAFIALRDRCPVLKKILIPDEIWQKFLQWHQHPDDIASHASVVLLAFIRGVLPRITVPIHRYLMTGDYIAPSATRQYVTDLRETWMLHADPSTRNRLCRTFRGRLIELQFAAWLEDHGHFIVGMEGIRQGPDIETISYAGQTAFEVKFFGQADEDSLVLLDAMHNGPSGGAVSLPEPINYLLFRVYEAARQLRPAKGQKTAIIVIDEMGWHRFDMQLNHDWIDWANPQFLGVPCEWERLLSLQKQGTGLPADLGATIRELDTLQIFRQNHAFVFRPEKEITFNGHTLDRACSACSGSCQ